MRSIDDPEHSLTQIRRIGQSMTGNHFDGIRFVIFHRQGFMYNGKRSLPYNFTKVICFMDLSRPHPRNVRSLRPGRVPRKGALLVRLCIGIAEAANHVIMNRTETLCNDAFKYDCQILQQETKQENKTKQNRTTTKTTTRMMVW